MNTNFSTTLRTLVAGAMLSSLAFGFPTMSSAEEGLTPPQAVVKFGDLDVSTAKGAQALYGRIERAAEDVCVRMYRSEEAYRWAKYRCLPQIIGDAVTKINSPALSGIYASKYVLAAPVVLAAAQTR